MSRAEGTMDGAGLAGAFTGAGIAASRPAAASSSSWGSARGSMLYREVQADVADFIENGSTNGASRATGPAGLASMQPSVWPAPARVSNAAGGVGSGGTGGTGGTGVPAEAQREFLDDIAPLARKAGERLGVAPDIVAAQAALESGWGRKPLRRADGSHAHNLFGIKAGGGWSGEVTTAVTHEQSAGGPLRSIESFRSYGDASAGFDDYAKLLADRTRYAGALGAGTDARAFANGLVQGGYATDPDYADKLVRLAEQVRAMKARP